MRPTEQAQDVPRGTCVQAVHACHTYRCSRRLGKYVCICIRALLCLAGSASAALALPWRGLRSFTPSFAGPHCPPGGTCARCPGPPAPARAPPCCSRAGQGTRGGGGVEALQAGMPKFWQKAARKGPGAYRWWAGPAALGCCRERACLPAPRRSLAFRAGRQSPLWARSQHPPDVGGRCLPVPVKLLRPLAPLARQLGGRLGGSLRRPQLGAQLAHLHGSGHGMVEGHTMTRRLP